MSYVISTLCANGTLTAQNHRKASVKGIFFAITESNLWGKLHSPIMSRLNSVLALYLLAIAISARAQQERKKVYPGGGTSPSKCLSTNKNRWDFNRQRPSQIECYSIFIHKHKDSSKCNFCTPKRPTRCLSASEMNPLRLPGKKWASRESPCYPITGYDGFVRNKLKMF